MSTSNESPNTTILAIEIAIRPGASTDMVLKPLVLPVVRLNS